ncbi:MAG: hypothetical protein E6H00_12960 [Bacillati bacterium ANGP1]|uniref:Dolichol phosphate-mannose biosynthesis regulatory protein n=1 Tax=Candidatus Segetimicrobium genomatis TaxID=2569760 RepID=A0A537JXR6_9BACT|nr:MAG: hypothetical protein E6H00_12960 [Terrabacteria group bacterium ANGP1]
MMKPILLLIAALYTAWVVAFFAYIIRSPQLTCTPAETPLAKYLFLIPAACVFGWLLVDSVIRMWKKAATWR